MILVESQKTAMSSESPIIVDRIARGSMYCRRLASVGLALLAFSGLFFSWLPTVILFV